MFIKNRLFSAIYFTVLGFVICLFTLFVLAGGKNYLKLYKELSKLINVYDTISNNYYGHINKNEVINNAVNAMVSSVGDGYTTYNDKDSTNVFMENIGGTYSGIGCSVTMNDDGKIIVSEVFVGGPAEAAGLKKGDIITHVNGKDFTDKTSNELSNYIKNSNLVSAELKILRNDKKKDIIIKLSSVSLPTIGSKVIESDNKKIGYISISIFSLNTFEQFKKELLSLEDKKIDGLIIDVRNNREYQESHIEGSINIPEYEINRDFEKTISNKEKEIVLYCASGFRSANAYKKLKKMGYKNVYCLYGGIENY